MEHASKKQKSNDADTEDRPVVYDLQDNCSILIDIVSLTWKLTFELMTRLQALNCLSQQELLGYCRLLLMLKCMTCRYYTHKIQCACFLFGNIKNAMRLVRIIMTGELRYRFRHSNLYLEYRYLVRQRYYRDNQVKTLPTCIVGDPIVDAQVARAREEEFEQRASTCCQLLDIRERHSLEKKQLKWQLELYGLSKQLKQRQIGLRLEYIQLEIGKLDEQIAKLLKKPGEFEKI